MNIYFYSLIPLLFLPADSSSIRDRNFRNDLVPFLSSRLDSPRKDPNSLKIVSNEPFVIQLQMPDRVGESTRKGSKEKDTKRKRPIKKRVSKLKPLRKRRRQRRDLQSPKIDLNRERKSNRLEISKSGTITEHQPENATTNPATRADILKALTSYTKKSETKKDKKGAKNFHHDEENGNDMEKYVSKKTLDGNVQRFSNSPLVKMVYPNAPKLDRNLHKYSYKDLISDRERLEKKIKYIREMMNLSAAEDEVRVRRRSESDRTANKIAKMFLTLSAVNGLHDRLRSKCDDEDDDGEDDEDGYRFWQKESRENPSKRSFSSNEERYKVKKWIEHMKSKRSSSKTCPCMAKDRDEDMDVFPLEQKLPKNYYSLQNSGGSEESSEVYGNPSYFHRDKLSKSNQNKRRNHKAREDQENKLKAMPGKGKKLELPIDDLELYRMKAKQILQNAEEILDKIKEEEEKRISTPNILMNQLKELTSRIQTDPRNNENDLIRNIQKTLGLGSASKPSEGTQGNGFLDNVKSFILDPYEKAKALTDESTKKLSRYLLLNLGEQQDSGEKKEEKKSDDKENPEVYFGQVSQKEEEELQPASLAKEKPDDNQTESSQLTVSSVLDGPNENEKKGDSSVHSEEKFKKRMEEIIKEQTKKLNGHEIKPEESSQEFPDGIGSRMSEQGESASAGSEESLKEDETGTLLQQKKEVIDNLEPTENYKTEKVDGSDIVRGSASKELDNVSEKEVTEGVEEIEKKPEEEKIEVVKEILRETEGNEERVESEVVPDYKESSVKEGEKEANGAKEESAVDSIQEKSNDQKKLEETVAAATPEEQEFHSRDASNADPDYAFITDVSGEVSRYGTDEKIEAKKPDYSKEGKSFGENVSEGQEAEPDPEKNSAGGFNETPNLSLDTSENLGSNDPALNKENKLQEKSNQNTESDKTQRVVEPQAGMEFPTLSKEAESIDSLVKKASSEDKNEAEGNDEQETLRLETPAEGREQGNTAKESPDEDEDQMGLTGAKKDGENPSEDYDESKKVSSSQEEQKVTDGSPLVSATSKESGEKTSSRQHSDEDGDGPSQETEASDANEGETLLKETHGEAEETKYSGEEVAMNNQSNEKDLDVNVDDAPSGVKATSEEAFDKLENPEGSNETFMKSIQNKSQEPDKSFEEFRLQAADPSQDMNDEGSETQNNDEKIDDKPVKSTHDVTDGLESLKEKSSDGIISEEQKEESLDEGEDFRSEATGSTRELDRETQNLANDDIRDAITKGRNSNERSGSGSDQDTLSRAADAQDTRNLNDKVEEIPSEMSGEMYEQNATADDETLKATLEEEDGKNLDEDVKAAGSLHAGESDEELKMSQDNLKHEAGDKTRETDAVLDDRTIENGDTDDEISLKAASNEEALDDNLNKNEEDDEAPLQETLDGQVEGMTAQDDFDTKALERNENSDDDPLIRSLNKDEQVTSKEFTETSLKTASPNEDLVKEVEDRIQSENVNDDTPLTVTPSKVDKEPAENTEGTLLKSIDHADNEGILEDTDDSPVEAVRNKGEETMEDTDDDPVKATRKDDEGNLEDADEATLRAVNIDDGPNDKGNSHKGDENTRDTEDFKEDDATADKEGQTFLTGKNSEKPHEENDASEDESPQMRSEHSEQLNNNLYGDDENPLRASTDDLNPFEPKSKDESDESLREANIQDDFNNQIDGDDEATLKSVKPFNGKQGEPEEGYETLKMENPSVDSAESSDQDIRTEDESPWAVADPVQYTNFQKNNKEIPSESLQELHRGKNPLKKSSLKVPSSIARIMKDLEGQEKDDLSTIGNLNPEKIDYIIDKIDEVEQQNKVTNEVDCRKECACAEDINTRSRNTGRYEIVKDFLQWMKDLQLNRVLSDD